MSNEREHFRVTCPLLCFDLRLSMLNGIPFPKKETKDNVLVENISIGGLKFHTHLFIPPGPKTIVRVSGILEGEPIETSGSLAWHQKTEAGNAYGVKFLEPIPIFPLITNLDRMIRKQKPLKKSDLCHGKCQNQVCLSVLEKLYSDSYLNVEEK